MVEYAAGGPGSTEDDAYELVIPSTWLQAFDIDDIDNADQAIGETVIIAAQDLEGNTETIDATIAGVAEETITGAGASPIPSHGLTERLAEINNTAAGTTVPTTYVQAIIIFDA